MPVTPGDASPRRNMLFAVLLLLPVLGGDVWGAVSASAAASGINTRPPPAPSPATVPQSLDNGVRMVTHPVSIERLHHLRGHDPLHGHRPVAAIERVVSIDDAIVLGRGESLHVRE